MRISDWSSDVCSSDLLAELFIKNTPEKNHADPRLSPAQAIVDAAMKTAADRGESARMVATIRESTRQLVADRIKAGGSLAGEIGRDRTSDVEGKRVSVRVDLGGRRTIKKKNTK